MRLRTELWCLAAAALVACPGCNILGPAGYILHGPERTPEAFVLPKERTAVVFVDDRQSYLPRRSLRMTIADTATRRLLDAKVVTAMVDSQSALAASTADQPGSLTDIITLGKSVGADLIIYATVDGFSLSPDRQAYNPTARVRVKVVDGQGGKGRVWPEDLRGQVVTAGFGERAAQVPDSPSTIVAAEDRLGAEIGRCIAELFYSHEAARSLSDR